MAGDLDLPGGALLRSQHLGEDVELLLNRFEKKNPQYKVIMSNAVARDLTGDAQRLICAIAGGTVMTLSWALLFKLMPAQHRGAISGLATTTKGIGLLIGAPAAGIAIDLARPYLDATSGYQILWPICALPILGAIPLLVRLIDAEAEADGRGQQSVAPVV